MKKWCVDSFLSSSQRLKIGSGYYGMFGYFFTIHSNRVSVSPWVAVTTNSRLDVGIEVLMAELEESHTR